MKKMFLLVVLFSITAFSAAYSQKKELFIPEKIWEVPEGNNFKKESSRFSYKRMLESDNLVFFWDVSFGKGDPVKNPDPALRFDVERIMQESERFYDYFTDTLKFVIKGSSLTDKYKMLGFIINDDDGTVYGGGAGDKIGCVWMRPVRMATYPYCAVAHELGHSFQYIVRMDGSEIQNAGAYGEMTSQWMLSHVYPDWITLENYHWVSLMKKTHFALFHETNIYHSSYIYEYWGYKHGDEIVGRLWRETKKNEDMVDSYKRITGINQEQFVAEMYDQSARLVTYDIPRIEKVARRYANQHSSKLLSESGGWYKIAKERCPQNYGYNGIRLNAPADGTTVTLQFKGLAGSEGYNAVNVDKAGWRYGFLAVKNNGERVYGEMASDPEGEITFTTPQDTQYLWLVVMGAPTEHWHHIFGQPETNEEWPYMIRLTGTTPHHYVLD